MINQESSLHPLKINHKAFIVDFITWNLQLFDTLKQQKELLAKKKTAERTSKIKFE